MTDGNHVLKGNINAVVYPPGSELNANFHTNGNLEVFGNAASVQGFGYYVGNAVGKPKKTLDNTFVPNVNPEKLSGTQKTAEIEIPTFDSDAWLSGVAVDQRDDGDVRLSGYIDKGGTRDNPYIWHVKGDLSAAGGATVSGYVMFVVEGNVDFSGNLNAGGTGYGGNESSVAFYTKGNVEFSGTVQVHGQIYANGNLIFRGTPDLYGTATAKGNAELAGTPTFHYRPASPALTGIWQDPVADQLVLASYSEW